MSLCAQWEMEGGSCAAVRGAVRHLHAPAFVENNTAADAQLEGIHSQMETLIIKCCVTFGEAFIFQLFLMILLPNYRFSKLLRHILIHNLHPFVRLLNWKPSFTNVKPLIFFWTKSKLITLYTLFKKAKTKGKKHLKTQCSGHHNTTAVNTRSFKIHIQDYDGLICWDRVVNCVQLPSRDPLMLYMQTYNYTYSNLQSFGQIHI